MPRLRAAAALTAAVILAQLLHRSPLVDVVSGTAPDDLSLSYPLLHVALAPLTLAADWLNGGSRGDLKGFAAWTLAAFLFARLFLARPPRRMRNELVAGVLLLGGLGGFVAWGVLLPRPIPRLSAHDPELVAFDVHSHTTLSHDGRKGFDARANANWHARAGFDAAFVTDHNEIGAAAAWRSAREARPSRLLDAEELSLYGLHVLALGTAERIGNQPWNRSFDSTLALLRALSQSDTSASGRTPPDTRPYLIASLPEYWRNHWGTGIGRAVEAGIEGFEIWTTSPRAMDLKPAARAEVVARAWLGGLALFGATDMHGLGNAATVWNVARLDGWRRMGDSALAAALIERFRSLGPASHRVVALRRWQAPSAAGSPATVPMNALLLLRTASRGHGVALLAWIWLPALLVRVRRRGR